MNVEPCIVVALRAAVVLSVGLAAMPLLRRAPAATRRLVLALTLSSAVVLPVASAVAPAWHVAPRASRALGALRAPFAEPLSDAASASTAVPGAAQPSPRAAQSGSVVVGPGTMIFGLWAIGALVVSARLVAGLLAARGLVRRSSAAPSWAPAIADAERAVGFRAEVRVSDDLEGPAVTGIVSPVVLVPRASEVWAPARRLAVLQHEIAHIQQRDCLAQVVAQVACALYWPNPLVWISARRLRLERELAADDAVVRAGTRATVYAEDLLAIGAAQRLPASALAMAERSQLAARVTAIVAPRGASAPLSRRGTAVVIAGAGAVLLAVACASPEGEPHAVPASASAASSGASTLDPRLQQLADEEIDRTIAEWHPAAATIVVLDPLTGEVLANAGRLHGAPSDVATRRAYVTGSTLKAVTLAAALEQGAVTLADRLDCEGGAWTYGGEALKDSTGYGSLSVPEMMAVSTNIGFAKIFDRLGGSHLGHWLHRFHLDAPTLADHSYEGALTAIGARIAATPLQMAAVYGAIANGGSYLSPTSMRGSRPTAERVMKPETAHAVVETLEGVVNRERATGKLARVEGVRVAGKTGTADGALPDGGEGVYASFIGIVPADHPRYVILVGVEAPPEGGSGGSVAAPVFARVATRALAR